MIVVVQRLQSRAQPHITIYTNVVLIQFKCPADDELIYVIINQSMHKYRGFHFFI